jgi:hypothetical protein
MIGQLVGKLFGGGGSGGSSAASAMADNLKKQEQSFKEQMEYQTKSNEMSTMHNLAMSSESITNQTRNSTINDITRQTMENIKSQEDRNKKSSENSKFS